jgi:hypothetical protein
MSNIHEANDHLSMLNIVKDLARRIEAIEQRQAKLAVEQVQTGDDETKEWDTLANMLGMETVAWMVGFVGEINLYGFEDDGKAERNLKAMLIGLACEECNGSVFYHTAKETTGWVWESHGLFQSPEDPEWNGELGSRPAAAIAMLNAYRGEE